MNLSKVKTQLKKYEGERFSMYQDSVGKWTIGCGHNLSDKPISSRASDIILEDDVQDTILGLLKAFPWFSLLNEPRQHALVNMAFNLGIHGLIGFPKMLDALSKGQWQVAHDEAINSTWSHQVHQRAQDIANTFLTGIE